MAAVVIEKQRRKENRQKGKKIASCNEKEQIIKNVFNQKSF